MKDSKYCQISSCCKEHRHELFGLILLIIATILTIVDHNSFGIVAMFIVGVILCCYRYFPLCTSHCHTHCCPGEEDSGNGQKPQVKKTSKKA